MWNASLESKLIQNLTGMREAVLHKIFLGLHKAYNAKDRDSCLNILVGYYVVPSSLRVLPAYSGRLTMVTKAGGCYAPPFNGYRSVTHGYHLFPMIFNVVVDAFIQHWVTVVVPTEVSVEVLGALVQYFAAYFYVDNRLVMSPWMEMLQRLFDVLINLFYWVGLRKNVRNMVSMAFQP